MAQIRWDVERVYNVVTRERYWFNLPIKVELGGGDDPIVAKRTFAKGDLTGARFEISCQLKHYCSASPMTMMISSLLLDGTMDNQTGWPSLARITCLGQWSAGGPISHNLWSEVNFTTATMTTGDITATAATIVFWFRSWDPPPGPWNEPVHLRSIKVMESNGVEKWFASVDASPIEELASDRYQVFNNEDDNVYYSTRAVDYSTFFELGANPNREFRIVNTRGAEITVTELSVLGSEQSVVDAWVSVKNHGDLPIVIGANASTDISVQVLASDAAIGDFFFVLKATWQGG